MTALALKMKMHRHLLKAQGKIMATSSILGGTQLPEEISGKDMHALGPSDNSDSGSDAVGAYSEEELDSDSDSAGTGERSSAGADLNSQPDADILPDHIEQAPGRQADAELDDMAGEDSQGLREVEDLANDSEDLEAESGEGDEEGDEEAGPARKA
jgi:hypothetical protein